MAIVIIAPGKKNLAEWKTGILEELQKNNLQAPVWLEEEVENPDRVRMVVSWKHPPQSLYHFPKLQLVASMGAGVDHILADPALPEHWQITRIVDPELSQSMSNYLLARVLSLHKNFDQLRQLQTKGQWGYTDHPELQLSIGILGLGTLGRDIATKLKQLGLQVSGYSQERKELPGVKSFAGKEQLQDFLDESQVIICLLPLTKTTEGILNIDFFRKCRIGTHIINVARGQHLVEKDLIPALEQGWLSGATLDVFNKEPLPQNHPFWNHPKITITPHIASVTKIEAAIPQLVSNYKRLCKGQPLLNRIDRAKCY